MEPASAWSIGFLASIRYLGIDIASPSSRALAVQLNALCSNKLVIELQSPIPDLGGERCEALIAQEFWHGGECISPANVLFLKTQAGSWQRIALDAGVLFWRTEAVPSFPTPADDSPEYGQHPLVDLGARHGLVGRRIEAVRVAERPDADELQLEFSGGVVVALRDLSDRDATDLEIRAPAA